MNVIILEPPTSIMSDIPEKYPSRVLLPLCVLLVNSLDVCVADPGFPPLKAKPIQSP